MTKADNPSDQKSESNAPCPTCKKQVPADAESYPFCNTRCRQADLGKWLSGDYVISRPLEQADFNED